MLLPLLLCLLTGAAAQGEMRLPANTPAGSVAEDRRMEIRSITITVEGETSPTTLKSEMHTVETPNWLSVFSYENVWERLGSARSIFDPNVFDRDIVRLHEYYREHGFFHAVIDTALKPAAANKLDIEIHVRENMRSLIDTVKIVGVESVAPDIAEEITANCLIKKGMPYTNDVLEQEQVRAMKIFRNGGYPDAQIVAIVPVRYLSTNNITVNLRYNPGMRYVFGKVTIAGDTVEVDPNVVFRQIEVVPGEVYNEDKKAISEQNLNRIGLLENASLKPMPRIDTVTPRAIPMQISYRVMELKEITPEVEINNEFGISTGLGLGYSHRNFIGNASTFSIHTRVSLQRPTEMDWDGAFKYGLKEKTLFVKADIQPQLYFPYFYGNRTSANTSLALEGEKTQAYTLTALRGKIGITHKFETFTTGYADWSLEYVDQKILETTLITELDTIPTKTNQFNSIVSFTLQRDMTDNLFSPTTGFFESVSLEESGLIPRTLGKRFGNQPFSEYLKVSFLLREYYSLNSVNSSIFAAKLHAGMARLYNGGDNPTPLPLTHRFFAGGSNSVRGWNYRDLSTLNESQALLGGNILFEASIENRFQLFRNWGKFLFMDLEAMWGVLFIDAGNLWNSPTDIKPRDVGIAAGIGFRYETFIGPVRFDIGVRMYDPKESPGNEWVFSKRLLQDSYSVFHFGLGHAF
jgi:outer membrane protein assembly factor BamA